MFKKNLYVPFIFLCLLLSAGLSQTADEDTNLYTRSVIRERFHDCLASGAAAGALVAELEEKSSRIEGDMPGHVFAYYAALRGLQAKHERNLIKKLEYLKLSLTLLDEAVARAGYDMEVRFVRFSSLHHFPNLLGIGKKRGRDIERLVTDLKKKDYSLVDQKTQMEMIRFLLDSDRLSKEQAAALSFVMENNK